MPTVYFDTSFYVNLREADEGTALVFLRDLDDLNIRFVLSRPLWQELIRSGASDSDQRRLVSRVQALRRPSLCLEDDLSWLLLCAPLEVRERVANAQDQIDGAVERTRSLRLLFESGSKEEQAQFMASHEDVMRQMGWLKDG